MPDERPPGHLSPKQIAIWSVVLGVPAALMVASSLRDPLGPQDYGERDDGTCYVRTDGAERGAVWETTFLFPDPQALQFAQRVHAAGDPSAAATIESATPKLAAGTRVKRLDSGAGWFRVSVLEGDHSGKSGFVVASQCRKSRAR